MTALFIDSGGSTQSAAVCSLRVRGCSCTCLGDDTWISNAAEGTDAPVCLCVVDACHTRGKCLCIPVWHTQAGYHLTNSL